MCRKLFGPIQALKDISISIGHNEIVGLIGDNGAGKSKRDESRLPPLSNLAS